MEKFSILIIDDEESQLLSLKSFLSRRGFQVFTAQTGPEGYQIVKENAIDLALTDYRMPDWNGFVVLKKIKELNPEIDVVVMTAYGRLEDAVEIMKAGAYDYLTKPIDLNELENLIQRVIEKHLLIEENKQLREQLKQRFKFDAIISQSGEMEAVLNTAARVAKSRASVLIRGESGTGKELVARAIHYASPRRDKPFVVVNIAALPENLVESELFGHEKGAFTGAIQQRIGRFEQANGGTLFIDEVGDIPLSVQVKLLRAIQFGEVGRIGGNKTIKVDVRIIAATNRNLEEMIQSREFREDLFYRLNVVTINIPPLSRRKSDIPVLVEHFIRKYSEENGKEIKGITREALDRPDLPLSLQSLSPKNSLLDPTNLDNSYHDKMKAFESTLITAALMQTNYNKSAAARLIGISERHLRSRIEKLGLKNLPKAQ